MKAEIKQEGRKFVIYIDGRKTNAWASTRAKAEKGLDKALASMGHTRRSAGASSRPSRPVSKPQADLSSLQARDNRGGRDLSLRETLNWVPEAARRGVSKAARGAASDGGFIAAYKKAGTLSKLPPYWKKKRSGFIARHMAQLKSDGPKPFPSRRELALIMWAYMPPRGRSRAKQNPEPAWVSPAGEFHAVGDPREGPIHEDIASRILQGQGRQVVRDNTSMLLADGWVRCTYSGIEYLGEMAPKAKRTVLRLLQAAAKREGPQRRMYIENYATPDARAKGISDYWSGPRRNYTTLEDVVGHLGGNEAVEALYEALL